MTVYSVDDRRMAEAPGRCRRCEHVTVTEHGPSGSRTVRWSCKRDLHMSDVCGAFLMTRNGLQKRPEVE